MEIRSTNATVTDERETFRDAHHLQQYAHAPRRGAWQRAHTGLSILIIVFTVTGCDHPLFDQKNADTDPPPTGTPAGEIDVVSDGRGIPSVVIDYNMDVRDFWAQHPANPNSNAYLATADIQHPAPQIDITTDHGGDVAAAIAAVMAAGGGTLTFGEGVYTLPPSAIYLFDTSGVHFVGAGASKTTIQATAKDSAFDILRSSTAYRAALSAGQNPGDPDVIDTYEDPDALDDQVSDFYFEGITFDGAGVSSNMVSFTAAEDAWFRDCVFHNILGSPASSHNGAVGSHAWSNNIWFENCTWSGTGNHAFVLDGTHGSGAVNCEVQFDLYPTAMEFWSNYDCTHKNAYTAGSNENYEPQEIRMGRYIVVDGCTFGATGSKNVMAISVKASDVLIQNNKMGLYGDPDSLGGHYFVKWESGYGNMVEQLNDGLDYIYSDLFVLNNEVAKINNFLIVSGNQAFASPPEAQTRVGAYTVQNNTVGSIFVEEIAIWSGDYVDGPATVTSNSWQ